MCSSPVYHFDRTLAAITGFTGCRKTNDPEIFTHVGANVEITMSKTVYFVFCSASNLEGLMLDAEPR